MKSSLAALSAGPTKPSCTLAIAWDRLSTGRPVTGLTMMVALICLGYVGHNHRLRSRIAANVGDADDAVARGTRHGDGRRANRSGRIDRNTREYHLVELTSEQPERTALEHVRVAIAAVVGGCAAPPGTATRDGANTRARLGGVGRFRTTAIQDGPRRIGRGIRFIDDQQRFEELDLVDDLGGLAGYVDIKVNRDADGRYSLTGRGRNSTRAVKHDVAQQLGIAFRPN